MSGGGICEFLALRRVRGGHVFVVDSRYYHNGIRMPAHLADVLDRLLKDGLVAPVKTESWERLVLTAAGKSHLADLERADPLSPKPRHG